MTSFVEQFSDLRRPKVLIKAAQYYLAAKNRTAAGIAQGKPPAAKSNGQLHRLIGDERHLEETRQTNDAEYSIKAHIEILAEIIAAAQTLRARRPTIV